MKLIWEMGGEGVIASQLHKKLRTLMKGRVISRAAILNYLNDLCAQGTLYFRKETCRGGRRKRYFPRISKAEYEKRYVRAILLKLLRVNPQYTIEALSELLTGKRFGPELSKSLLSYFMVRDELTYHTLEETLWGSGNPIHRY
ncbi:MAG: hypothetical protein ACUVTM_00585 [Candidatus Bathyarchaeia archaeon]